MRFAHLASPSGRKWFRQEAEVKLAAVRQRAEVEKREAAALLARSDAEKRRVQEKYQKARTTLREITAEFHNVRIRQPLSPSPATLLRPAATAAARSVHGR